MIKELIEQLFEEKDGFYEYIEMAHKAVDPSHRQLFTKIAEDELGHYKEIYGIIFKDKHPEHMSEIEKSFHRMATRECEAMKAHLAEFKVMK